MPSRRANRAKDSACAWIGYEAEWLEEYLKSRRYEPHIQLRKEESEAIKGTDFKARRWGVERTHNWMNRYRRVLTRWEKRFENYEAMLHFVCGVIVWNKILLGWNLNLYFFRNWIRANHTALFFDITWQY